MIYGNIISLCKERKISVSKLEREVGLGNGTIKTWQKSSPSVDNLKLVADYFGVTVDALMRTDVSYLLPTPTA